MEGSRTLFCSYKISMGTRKKFFEIYRQFGHAPPKSLANPGPRRMDEYQSRFQGGGEEEIFTHDENVTWILRVPTKRTSHPTVRNQL